MCFPIFPILLAAGEQFYNSMPKSTAHYAVVANPGSVSETISKVLDKNAQIDNLVTSAGFTENFDAISYPFDRMQKLWGVNVDGWIYLRLVLLII
jgi:NADP-dependent 3-hydroxy acid dehydrogenase YdfG